MIARKRPLEGWLAALGLVLELGLGSGLELGFGLGFGLGLGPAAAAAAPQDGAAAELARSMRELRRAGQAEQALARLDGLAPGAPLLADDRIAGERLSALMDLERPEEAAKLDAELGPKRQLALPLLVARARLEALAGHGDVALRLLDAAGTGFANQPDVVAVRALALAATEDYRSAMEAAASISIPALGARATADVLLTRARTELDDPDLVERAIPRLEQALQLQPRRVDIRSELVSALADWHRAERAIELAEAGLAQGGAAEAPDGRRADLLVALGSVYRAELQDAEAVRCFEQALAVAPRHGHALVALARCRLRAGQADEARSLLARRLAERPDDVEALFLRAEDSLESRDPGAALESLQRVLAQKPASLKALYMLSRAQAMQGLVDEQARTLARYTDRRRQLAAR